MHYSEGLNFSERSEKLACITNILECGELNARVSKGNF